MGLEKRMKLILLIAHYNNPDGLKKSLLSIRENFEVDVMIVDDGSEKKPDFENLKSLYRNSQLFIEVLPENKGVGYASNYGFKKILNLNYDLVGRLDCGDLPHPHKYEKQISYLNENQDVELLGTWVSMIDIKGFFLFNLKHPTDYRKIKNKIFINSTFVNSSVIFYTSILNEIGLYPEEFKRNAEDYAFFFKVVKRYKAENLPQILLDYEVNPNSLSSLGRKEQVRARIKIIKSNFHWGFYPVYGLLRAYLLLFFPRELTVEFRKAISRPQKDKFLSTINDLYKKH